MSPEIHSLPQVEPPGETLFVVKEQNVSPPIGWNYRDKITGREWSRQPALEELAREVAQHRTFNQLEVGDPRRDIMHFTGSMLVDSGHAALVVTHAPVHTSLLEYWEGAGAYKVISRAVAAGDPLFVSLEKARERAETCIACPRNVVPTRRSTVKRASDWVMRKRVGGRKIGLEDQLKTCQVCSCQTAVLVNLTEEILAATGSFKDLANYPPNCWKHRCKQHATVRS